MADLNIRGVPDPVHETLKHEAARLRRSVTSLTIELLVDYAQAVRRREELAGRVEAMDRIRDEIQARVGLTSDSASLLYEDRHR